MSSESPFQGKLISNMNTVPYTDQRSFVHRRTEKDERKDDKIEYDHSLRVNKHNKTPFLANRTVHGWFK